MNIVMISTMQLTPTRVPIIGDNDLEISVGRVY